MEPITNENSEQLQDVNEGGNELKEMEKVAEPAKAAKPEKVITASKTARKKIYKEESVFKLDPDDDSSSEEIDLRKTTFLELAASAKQGKILTGMVDGERTTKMGEIAEVSYNGFTVLIPAEEMFEIPEEVKKLNPTGLNSIASWTKNQINHRLGSTIDFVVRQVDEKNRIAVASRIEAMYAKAHEHYGVSKTNDTPLLAPGMIAEARVVAVSGVSIIAEVFGCDCLIKQEELSWNRLAEVDAEYNVGDVVKVRIMDVKSEVVERNIILNGIVTKRPAIRYRVTASVKRAGKNPSDEFYDDFAIGGNYLAKVTQVTDKGIYVRMKDKIDALCPLPDELQIPKVGAVVLVCVKEKIDETKLIYAVVKKIIRNS